MKKNVLCLLALICSLSFFTACNDDDDKLEPIGDSVTGVYLGELKIALGDEKPGDDAEKIAQKVYITKTGDNTIEMQLKNFSFGAIELGTIKVDQCEAIKEGESYKFKGAQSMKLESVGDCDVALTGVIVGNKIDMDISVLAKADGATLNVQVIFSGTKLAADLSSEADMLTFTFDSNKIIGQPVISENDGTITFNVSKEITEEELSALVPQFTISPDATVTPASGEPQDFTDGQVVTYTVTSQDKVVVKKYKVSVKGEVYHYSFDAWGIKTAGNYKYDYVMNADWDSSNDAVSTLITLGCYGKEDPFPILEVEAGKVGSAGSVATLDTKGKNIFGMRVPKITAGTLFTGLFKTNATVPLKSTQFGIPFAAKPAALKGYYKYTPGADYYLVGATIDKATIDPTKHDECSIVAVLFEASGNEVLDGASINDPNQVVLRAELFDGNTVTEWKEFNIQFEAKNGFVYDSSKSYKLAIVCSSSKNGATYSGAPGSVLMIDEFEVVLAN